MANYLIIATNSTLGAQGSTIKEEEILAASYTVDQLIEHGVIEIPTKTTTTKDKE